MESFVSEEKDFESVQLCDKMTAELLQDRSRTEKVETCEEAHRTVLVLHRTLHDEL